MFLFAIARCHWMISLSPWSTGRGLLSNWSFVDIWIFLTQDRRYQNQVIWSNAWNWIRKLLLTCISFTTEISTRIRIRNYILLMAFLFSQLMDPMLICLRRRKHLQHMGLPAAKEPNRKRLSALDAYMMHWTVWFLMQVSTRLSLTKWLSPRHRLPMLIKQSGIARSLSQWIVDIHQYQHFCDLLTAIPILLHAWRLLISKLNNKPFPQMTRMSMFIWPKAEETIT